MFLAQGVVPRSWTLQDTKLGFWRQFGNGVSTEACTSIFGDGSGAQRPANQARGTGRCHHSGCVKLSWANPGMLEAAQWEAYEQSQAHRRLGTLGEGEPNTVGRAELMACVVAAESTRGNVVHITDREILKKRQDRGWPTPRFGQGSNPDLWWRMSRALKSRQGTFTVQWPRAHVAAVDIKHENRDVALVFGSEMAAAVAKLAASEAALRGAAAEQVAWVDALAWQVQRRIIEANLQASRTTPTFFLIFRERGLRTAQYKIVLQPLFEQSTHQLAFRRSRQRWECQVCKQSMGETSLVRWLRADPCAGEVQTMQSIGNSLGLGVQQVRGGAYIPIGWKFVRPSHSVAQYRVITWCWICAAWTARSLCKRSTQCSGVIKPSALDALSRIKRGHPPRARMSWPLPATESQELLEWPLTAPVYVAVPS